MSPILPIAAAALAFFVLRRPKSRAVPSAPPPDQSPAPLGNGDGEPPPPVPPKKYGKDFVADVGLGSRGTKPPPKGGGLVFPGPNTPPKPPAPTPTPFHPQQAYPVFPHVLPAGQHYQDNLASVNEAHEVLLSDQLGASPMPNGTYRMRLVFVMSVSAPKLVPHPTTFGWDYTQTWIYTQREVIDYEITIDNAAAGIVKKSATMTLEDHKLEPFMFGCSTKQECGWNGKYTSFFHPRLVWDNGLELRFDTRALAVDPELGGILRSGVDATITFAEAS